MLLVVNNLRCYKKVKSHLEGACKMFRSPNLEYLDESNSFFDPYERGDNHIGKRFSKALDVLLTPDYYEGTKLGKYYNEIDSNGHSTVYVEQKELQDRLQTKFLDRQTDLAMYLVGYTGVGKTTLIRNFFHVFDRKIAVSDNNLVIYLSFYATAASTKERPKEWLLRIIEQSVKMACTYVAGYENYAEMVRNYNEDVYKNIYTFIEGNNSNLAHGSVDPLDDIEIDTNNYYRSFLTGLKRQDPLDFRMSMLKYYLEAKQVKYDNIIFIFDDLETLNEEEREEAIRLAMHIKKCMQAFQRRSYHIKVLIALRNYAFRMHTIRELEAFRVVLESDVILKDKVPPLGEIVKVRMEKLLENADVAVVKDQNAYEIMGKKLLRVLQKMYGSYDEMLLELTHYNIFTSMRLLARIITNKRYFGSNEKEEKGAFVINPEDYPVYNNASVFF